MARGEAVRQWNNDLVVVPSGIGSSCAMLWSLVLGPLLAFDNSRKPRGCPQCKRNETSRVTHKGTRSGACALRDAAAKGYTDLIKQLLQL